MSPEPFTILRDGQKVLDIRGRLSTRSKWAVDVSGGWVRQRFYGLLAAPGIDITEGDIVATTEELDDGRQKVTTQRRVVEIQARWPKTYALLEGAPDGKSQ